MKRAALYGGVGLVVLVGGWKAYSWFDARRDYRRALREPLRTDPVLAAPARHQRQLDSVPEEADRTVRPSERLRTVGRVMGAEPYVFESIRDIEPIGRADTVLVADGGASRIRAYSASGEHLYGFGRPGEGPGEYGEPAALLEPGDRTDRLAVWDPAYQRLTRVGPRGELMGTVSVGPQRPSRPLMEVARRVTRVAAVPGGYVAEFRPDPMSTPVSLQRGHLVKLDTTGAVRDTLLTFRVPGIEGAHRESAGESHSRWEKPPVFSPDASWDAFGDGTVVFSPGGTYRVYVVDPDGEIVLRLERPFRPDPVDADDRRLRLEHEMETRAGNADPPGGLTRDALLRLLMELARARDMFAPVEPAVSGVLAEEPGFFWVRRFSLESDPVGRSRLWDCYTREGDPVRTVRFPPAFRPLDFEGGRVYGVHRDSLGVERMAVYALGCRGGAGSEAVADGAPVPGGDPPGATGGGPGVASFRPAPGGDGGREP